VPVHRARRQRSQQLRLQPPSLPSPLTKFSLQTAVHYCTSQDCHKATRIQDQVNVVGGGGGGAARVFRPF